VRPAGLVLLGLFAIAGLFLFTLALIMPTDGALRYRRFIKWHTIEYQEIVQCKRSLFPLVGYMKLNRFLPPWGRLYFVFHTPSEPFFGRSAQKAIVQYIQDKMAGKAGLDTRGETKIEVHVAAPEKKGSLPVCALWALLGFVWVLFVRLVLDFQHTIPTPSVFAHENILYSLGLALWRLGTQLLDWPYNILVILAILALILASRFRRSGWAPAAALGFFVSELLVRFLRR